MRTVSGAALLVALAIPAAGAWSTLQAQTAGTRPAIKACSLLTTAEIARITGRADFADMRQLQSSDEDVPGTSSCGLLGSTLHIHFERVEPASFTAMADEQIRSGQMQAVSGVGDAAWFGSRNEKYELVVRLGEDKVTLSITGTESGSADATKTMLVPLARAALAKLRT